MFKDYEDSNGVIHPGAWQQITQNDTGMRELGRVGAKYYSRMYTFHHTFPLNISNSLT